MASLKRDKILFAKPIDEFLIELISDEFSLYLKTKTAFWNFEYNKLSKEKKIFELQYIEINSLIENIGRRIRDIESDVFLPRKIELLSNGCSSVLSQKEEAIEYLVKKNQKIIKKIKERRLIDFASSDSGTKELYHTLLLKHENIVERLKNSIKLLE
jgi:starvation-inducible DNA-binding protein